MWALLLLLATGPGAVWGLECHVDRAALWTNITTTLGTTAIDAARFDALVAACKARNACIPHGYRWTGADALRACDVDGNGLIEEFDWSHPAGCFEMEPRRIYACRTLNCYEEHVLGAK